MGIFLVETGIALVAQWDFVAVIGRMKIPFHATTARHIKGATGILIAFLVYGFGEVRGQATQGSYDIKLSWKASGSTNVTGYRIQYGTVSGAYPASVVLGNVTSATVSGFAEGVTYYFVLRAVNSAGVESDATNEISFKPGLHTARMRANANMGTVLYVRGRIGLQYDIEASADMKTWSLVNTVTMPAGGWLDYSDPQAANHAARFYRTRQRP